MQQLFSTTVVLSSTARICIDKLTFKQQECADWGNGIRYRYTRVLIDTSIIYVHIIPGDMTVLVNQALIAIVYP